MRRLERRDGLTFDVSGTFFGRNFWAVRSGRILFCGGMLEMGMQNAVVAYSILLHTLYFSVFHLSPVLQLP